MAAEAGEAAAVRLTQRSRGGSKLRRDAAGAAAGVKAARRAAAAVVSVWQMLFNKEK